MSVCNPSISLELPLQSISSLGSGGTPDGVAIPFCVMSGSQIPEITPTYGQCYEQVNAMRVMISLEALATPLVREGSICGILTVLTY